jgi:hypothetical protein
MIVHSPLRRYQVRKRPQHLLSRFPVAIVFLFHHSSGIGDERVIAQSAVQRNAPRGTHEVMNRVEGRRNSLHARKARKPLVASPSSNMPCMIRLLKL